MNFQLRKKLIISAILQLSILAISFIFHHKLSLFNYINISFYISVALLITSLLIYVIQTGFLDVISKSFNLAFTRGKGKDKRNWEDIPSLSELITMNNKPLLFYGLITGFLMLIALFIYYV
ncbi:MAG TPA: DUF3899 domain-containing protein [Neobacillus sp.]